MAGAAAGPIVLLLSSLTGLITSAADVGAVGGAMGKMRDAATAAGAPADYDFGVKYGSGYGLMVTVLIMYIAMFAMHASMVIMHAMKRGQGGSVKAVSSIRTNPVTVTVGMSGV